VETFLVLSERCSSYALQPFNGEFTASLREFVDVL
jgi:hypothetical protein